MSPRRCATSASFRRRYQASSRENFEGLQGDLAHLLFLIVEREDESLIETDAPARRDVDLILGQGAGGLVAEQRIGIVLHVGEQNVDHIVVAADASESPLRLNPQLLVLR